MRWMNTQAVIYESLSHLFTIVGFPPSAMRRERYRPLPVSKFVFLRTGAFLAGLGS